MISATAAKPRRTKPEIPFDDDKRLCFVDYWDQIKSGALHVHCRPNDKLYVLRAESVHFSPESVLLTSDRGDECSFTRRWVTAVNSK